MPNSGLLASGTVRCVPQHSLLIISCDLYGHPPSCPCFLIAPPAAVPLLQYSPSLVSTPVPPHRILLYHPVVAISVATRNLRWYSSTWSRDPPPPFPTFSTVPRNIFLAFILTLCTFNILRSRPPFRCLPALRFASAQNIITPDLTQHAWSHRSFVHNIQRKYLYYLTCRIVLPPCRLLSISISTYIKHSKTSLSVLPHGTRVTASKS